MSRTRPGAAFASFYRNAYTAFQYRLRTLGGGLWNDYCRPTDIAFLMTQRCQSRCVHCDGWKNTGNEDFPAPEQYKAALSDLRRWLGPVHVYLTGGEALLCPWTPEVLAHGVSAGLFMELLTNGYCEDQSRIERVARADPWRVTVSLDAAGKTHNVIRGRDDFWDKTRSSIETLLRVRRERRLSFTVRLKTVIMSQNLNEAAHVAHFAAHHQGMDVFYQPIEPNYYSPVDGRWFESSGNWPKNAERAEAVIRKIIRLKRSGLPIGNSLRQLNTMIRYFHHPEEIGEAVQRHAAHEQKALCSALSGMQILPNGDVRVCYGMPPIGNIKQTPIRVIWENRPRWWKEGCCLDIRELGCANSGVDCER